MLCIPIFAYLIMYIVFNTGKKKIVNGLSGFEVSRKILDDNNLDNMYIVEVKGILNDHYDTSQKVVRLSTDVFHEETIAAITVSSFISSYALLDKQDDSLMKIKKMLDPIVNFLVFMSYFLFVIGLFINELFGLALVFLLLTIIYNLCMIPLCLKAKNLALEQLAKYDIKEHSGLINSILNVYLCNELASIIFDVVNSFSDLIKRTKK